MSVFKDIIGNAYKCYGDVIKDIYECKDIPSYVVIIKTESNFNEKFDILYEIGEFATCYLDSYDGLLGSDSFTICKSYYMRNGMVDYEIKTGYIIDIEKDRGKYNDQLKKIEYIITYYKSLG
jgi:hypothetical protein